MLLEMEISEVCLSAETNLVVLREKEPPRRNLPIFIGEYEARSLEMALHDMEMPRPLTHDLVLNLLEGMGGVLRRIIIDKLDQNTYFCKLDVEQKNHVSAWIDCRPSDALVLATKTGCAIYTDAQVLVDSNAQPQEDPEEE